MLPGSPVRHQPGECLWYRLDNQPLTHADVERSRATDRAVRQHDHWDPWKAGVTTKDAFIKFDRSSAAKCLQDKHIFVIGESTTRDLYYEFANFAGLSPDKSYCMNLKNRPKCSKVTRDTRNNVRLSFQFISQSNTSTEISIAQNLTNDRTPDVVFAYCMSYDYLSPLMHSEDDAMGAACLELVERAVLLRAPHVPVFILGPIYAPSWVGEYENRTLPDSSTARIFRSINHAAGISCARTSHGDYKIQHTRWPYKGAIDRYNVVGRDRKRDMVHPYPSAHVPVIQMMLNFLCPAAKPSSRLGSVDL